MPVIALVNNENCDSISLFFKKTNIYFRKRTLFEKMRLLKST